MELHSTGGHGYVHGNGMEKSPRNTETETLSMDDRDAQALARLGKKAVLKASTGYAVGSHGPEASQTDEHSGDSLSCPSWALRAQFSSRGKRS